MEGDSDTDIGSDGTLAVAFTGKLDNLSDMVGEIRDRGAGGKAFTPASVIIAAWRLFGEAVLHRFRGCFAAALTDGTRVWCFRDHFGRRLLFYRDDPRGFYAATEVKQVIAGAGIAREPNLEALEQYFLLGYPEDPSVCYLKGVQRLPLTTLLTADEATVSTRRYWDPAPILETHRPSDQQLKTEFEALMSQACERTLDGPTVISLSGGLDSATIAAFAASAHRANPRGSIAALSAVFPGWPSVDESQHIRLLTDALGINLHTYEPAVNPFEALADWARLLDGPVPRRVTVHETGEFYRKAKALGFRTILSGDFAEWLNLSGPYLGAHLLHRRRFRAAWRHFRTRRALGASRRAIAKEVLGAFAPRIVEEAYSRIRTRGSVTIDWLDSRMLVNSRIRSWTPPGDRWRRSQLSPLNVLGVTWEALEICQAVCGVRVRLPWADIDLWRYFLSLPAETKFVFDDPRPKALIRRLLRGRVPDVILDRVDKPRFMGYYLERLDYQLLREWLARPKHRITGVRYEVLADHLQREDFTMVDFLWARDLAAVQAFLSQW